MIHRRIAAGDWQNQVRGIPTSGFNAASPCWRPEPAALPAKSLDREREGCTAYASFCERDLSPNERTSRTSNPLHGRTAFAEGRSLLLWAVLAAHLALELHYIVFQAAVCLQSLCTGPTNLQAGPMGGP